MDLPEKIDLHMHSTVSDGTDTPAEILSLVKEAGIDLFSLTDHDSVSGCEEIRGLLSPEDPLFLPGVEFSCRDEEGKYHILGYGYDTDSPAILKVVEKGRGFRMRKVRERLDYLRERFGFIFSKEDLESLFSRSTPGKPHIANLMVEHGYASSINDAIHNYIDQKRFRSEYVRPEEAIRGILGSGGIPVLAHPSYGSGGELVIGDELKDRVRKLMDFGLQGLEAYYSGFTPKLQSELLRIAADNDLYVTAGSDYHGTNKMIPPGETNLESTREGAPGLRRFLETVLG